MKCSRCKRPLKPGNTTGIGPICARVVFAGDGSSPVPVVKCHLLGKRPDGSRRYVVFEEGEEYRVILSEKRISGRTFGVCDCSNRGCTHVAAAITKEKGNNETGRRNGGQK